MEGSLHGRQLEHLLSPDAKRLIDQGLGFEYGRLVFDLLASYVVEHSGCTRHSSTSAELVASVRSLSNINAAWLRTLEETCTLLDLARFGSQPVGSATLQCLASDTEILLSRRCQDADEQIPPESCSPPTMVCQQGPGGVSCQGQHDIESTRDRDSLPQHDEHRIASDFDVTFTPQETLAGVAAKLPRVTVSPGGSKATPPWLTRVWDQTRMTAGGFLHSTADSSVCGTVLSGGSDLQSVFAETSSRQPRAQRRWVITFLAGMSAVLFLSMGVGHPARRPNVRLTQSPWAIVPTFPWPPPRASTFWRLPRDVVIGPEDHPTLGSVAGRLYRSMERAGYTEVAYFGTPGGLALVSPMERFAEAGLPAIGKECRKLCERPLGSPSFDLTGCLARLSMAPAGRYRVLVFVIALQTSNPDQESAPYVNAPDWSGVGSIAVPCWLAALPYSDSHVCVAMVYEFERRSESGPPKVVHSSMDAHAQLAALGILSDLVSRGPTGSAVVHPPRTLWIRSLPRLPGPDDHF